MSDKSTFDQTPMTGAQPIAEAAKYADWMQVVLNQGPPCFHLEGHRFCFRAERWDGHTHRGLAHPDHDFVSLADLLAALSLSREGAPPPSDERPEIEQATCATCFHLGERTDPFCAHPSEAHPLHWQEITMDVRAFGCTLHERRPVPQKG